MQQDTAQQQAEIEAQEQAGADALMAAAGYVPEAAYADDSEPESMEPEPLTPASRRRLLWAIALLFLLGSAAVLPPLINVNQYQRRIATSISISLGRPVHLDSVTLNLLPMPGFTLTNFVVSEDPSFGSEPVIRANTVTARLRLRSLWRHQVEFSRISLVEPSVNLVRRRDGRWNIESILLQASRMPAVPTEQKNAGDRPRFPYIEATGARVNLKQGLEKKPISLTDAEFALWLSQPDTWSLRLEAHPARTDTAATDTGTLRLAGTLGKASLLAQVPLDLRAEWRGAPLGAASWVLLGRDAGARGEMTAQAAIQGTLGENVVTATLDLRGVRRADFVPAKTLDINLNCRMHPEHVFHRLTDLTCAWPAAADRGGLTLTGEVPDLRNWRSAMLQARWNAVPVSSVLDAVRVFSARDSQTLRAAGELSGELQCCDPADPLLASGTFTVAKPLLATGESNLFAEPSDIKGELTGGSVILDQLTLNLGAAQPASLTITADRTGFAMRLAGLATRRRLLALGAAIPQFGDGLEQVLPPPGSASSDAPLKLDLLGTRTWSGVHRWEAEPKVASAKKRRR